MTVSEIRGRRTFAGPGSWALTAEARVYDDAGNMWFVMINEYDMFRHYTVSAVSTYALMTGEDDEGPEDVEDVESYESLAETKSSQYAKVFDTLSKVITRLGKGC